MSGRAFKTILAPALAAALCACGAANKIYNAVTRRTVTVATTGMSPTLKPGDRVVVDFDFYVTNPVRRFDIVVFKSPEENIPDIPGEDKGSGVFVQRVIAFGGETIEIKGGRVYVNGQILEEPFATVPPDADEEFGPLKIPEGEFFLLGDDRRNSYDSRYWPRPTLPGSYIPSKVVEVLPK